jgi:hypothetical protein
MLSEIETSCSAMAFGNDAFDGTRTALADARGAFRLHGTGSHPASDSFFCIAMRISGRRVRACRRDRRSLSA